MPSSDIRGDSRGGECCYNETAAGLWMNITKLKKRLEKLKN
jgi:hypothetical protein